MYYENYENVVAQKNNEQKYILKELPTQPICIISLSSVTNSNDSQKNSQICNLFQVYNADFSQPLNSIHKDNL